MNKFPPSVNQELPLKVEVLIQLHSAADRFYMHGFDEIGGKDLRKI